MSIFNLAKSEAAVEILRNLRPAELQFAMEAFAMAKPKEALESISSLSKGVAKNLRNLENINSEYATTLMLLDSPAEKEAFRARHLRSVLMSGICRGTIQEKKWEAELKELCLDPGTAAYLKSVCYV